MKKKKNTYQVGHVMRQGRLVAHRGNDMWNFCANHLTQQVSRRRSRIVRRNNGAHHCYSVQALLRRRALREDRRGVGCVDAAYTDGRDGGTPLFVEGMEDLSDAGWADDGLGILFAMPRCT